MEILEGSLRQHLGAMLTCIRQNVCVGCVIRACFQFRRFTADEIRVES